MSYLNITKADLINLEHSLSREIIRSNRSGTHASSTIVECNTRKYHGLLVCPIKKFNNEHHVLLSSLDLSIIYDKSEFNLGIRKYNGDVYHPGGHKYIQEFNAEETTQLIYRVGGVRILRESLLVEEEQQILIKYTILEADKPVELKFTPFLAFRNMHALSKANMHANTKIKHVEGGIQTCLYEGYPNLFMQFSKKAEFLQIPDWYYNVKYSKEEERGYECLEDLFVPGYFEVAAKQNDEIIFSASTKQGAVRGFKRKFSAGVSTRIPRNTYKNCLLNSAEQFIINHEKGIDIKAGYHWLHIKSRDTFVSLPGLTLTEGKNDTYWNVIDTQLKRLKNGLFPNVSTNGEVIFKSADASLWFFWTLQQYYLKFGEGKEIWLNYGKHLKKILSTFKKGTELSVYMADNGLLCAGDFGYAVTWMDAISEGKPVTPRMGFAVEVNALWYNAIQFALTLANEAGDKSFAKTWNPVCEQIEENFIQTFWDEEKEYLADSVFADKKDWTVRPNQVIAAALHYTPLTIEMRNSIIENVKRNLLTSKGLRTLSPFSEQYKGRCFGSQYDRDKVMHNGTVWPWLLQFYCQAVALVHKKSGVEQIRKILSSMEVEMTDHGISTIPEMFDGDPPHEARGCISQAWSVAAMLAIIDTIDQIE